MEAQRTRRRYDHRFRSIVHETGDIELAVRKGVPRSTARDWSRLAPSEVLTFDVASMSEQELRKEVTQLRERNARLQAILRLIVVLLKVCDVSMVRRRLPSGQKKRALLRAVDRSTESLPLGKALRLLGPSTAEIIHPVELDVTPQVVDFDSGESGDNAVAFPILQFGSYLVALERRR